MKIRQEQFFENMQKAQSQYLDELKSLRTRQDEMVNQQNNFYRQIKREQEKTIKEIEEVKKFQIREWTRNASSREGYCCWAHQQANPNLVEIRPHKIPDSFIAMWQTRRILTLDLSNQICNKEKNPKLPKILLILRIKEKKQKEAWKARKEENRAIGKKQSYSEKYRVLTPRCHYPHLDMAELQGLFSLIHHPTPTRDARRLGVDEAARKMTLHQGLNA
ncbi:hypothetical protein PIB30_064253 [Stylosanthes scabra]|uniref:Uncharacterized protein n=1 Tax=Stylosanthes scabra TaxID=79078 RepID=A0ABU6WMD4_9FABA|nr:hypothetical protein [Stylosanthes scabra]